MTSEKLRAKVMWMLGPRYPGLSPDEILQVVTHVPLDLVVCGLCDSLIQYIAVMGEVLWDEDVRAFAVGMRTVPPLDPVAPAVPAATAYERLMAPDDAI